MQQPRCCSFLRRMLVLALLSGDVRRAERDEVSDTELDLGDRGTQQPLPRMANKTIALHQLLQLREYTCPDFHPYLCEFLTQLGGFRERYSGESDKGNVQRSDGTRRSLRIVCFQDNYTLLEWSKTFFGDYKFVVVAELFSFRVVQNQTSKAFAPTKEEAKPLASWHVSTTALRCISVHEIEVDLTSQKCKGVSCSDCTLQMRLHYENREGYSLSDDPTLKCTLPIGELFLGDPLRPKGWPGGVTMGIFRRRHQGVDFSEQDFKLHVFIDYLPDGSRLVMSSELTSKATRLVSWKSNKAIVTSWQWQKVTVVLGVPAERKDVPEKLRTITTCTSRLEMSVDRDVKNAQAKLYCDGGSTPLLTLSSNALA